MSAPEAIPVEMNAYLAHAGGVLMMPGEIHQATVVHEGWDQSAPPKGITS